MEANDSHIAIKILRGVLYLVGIVLVILGITTAIFVGYYTGKNTMNVDMIVKDAFAKRAHVILQPTDVNTDKETLQDVFTESFISQDASLKTVTYDAYDISNYYQHTEIDKHITWQWDEVTEIIATDTVRDIKGEYIPTDFLTTEDIDAMDVPQIEQWNNAKYKVKLVKINDAWKIDELELIEEIYIPEIIKTPKNEEPLASSTKTTDENANGTQTSNPDVEATVNTG